MLFQEALHYHTRMKITLVPVFAIATALLMGGCVDSPQSYLAAHRDIPPNIAASMRQGDVVAGMTREQVRIIWGTPDRKGGWSGGASWTYIRSGNGGADRLSSTWGQPINNGTTAQQNQLPLSPSMMTAGKPRRMVYFRGDQVVLVEKAEGEL